MRMFQLGCLVSILLGLILVRTSLAAEAAPLNTDFSCSGDIHTQALTDWKRVAQRYFAQELDTRLNKTGDVYALYDVQEVAQAFVEMTRRCKDVDQIAELVATFSPALSSLRPLPNAPEVRGWVCTGGSTCTAANRLRGAEVPLDSAQFLGLLGAVATDIVEVVPVSKRSPAETAFMTNVASAMAEQVNHWLSQAYFTNVAQRTAMNPAAINNGSSRYFFLDTDLWFMTILSDLSELYEAHVKFTAAGFDAMHDLQEKRSGITSLFNLFLKRTTLSQTGSGGLRADIDSGFWRDYADNRYALYTGTQSPLSCEESQSGRTLVALKVPATAAFIDPDGGWDISHARRLVPALATFVRNVRNISRVFDYANTRFDPANLQRAFANQVVDKIWNQNSSHPLFSNFWDGANGWYRVGYDSSTHGCAPGTPPYGLAWSIPTGGFLAWGTVNGAIQTFGATLYQLVNAKDPKSRAFIREFYPQIQLQGSGEPAVATEIWLLPMLSSLVQ